MSFVQLRTELRQELKLTPQMVQSMEVLQMTSQELLDYVGQMAEENPLLDQSGPPKEGAAGWPGAAFTHEAPASQEPGRVDWALESLEAFLRDQLDRLRLPRPLRALTRYLVELLDEDGYLAQEDLEGLLEMKLPPDLVDRAVAILQGLDPPGVGARSLGECLLLQLGRKGVTDPAVQAVAERCLPELGRKRYAAIARKLGLRLEEVKAAAELIAALDPRPGAAFSPAEPPEFVRPDLFITEQAGELRVLLNEGYLPRVSINEYYLRLLKETDDKETRAYLKQKLQQAKWLLESLERRGGTLRRCAEAVLEVQRPFFAGETASLAPMTLSAMAERLALHPSTVSRTVRGKYIQCRQGTFPLRYFFSLPVNGSSRQAVKQTLLVLLREEDPAHPWSDQCLTRMLEERGMAVARRTVAKYREELGVGSSTARRR